MTDLPVATSNGRPVFFHDAPGGNAHWWFAALDQRWFTTGANRWLTQVVGIHEAEEGVWIQLQTLGDHLRDVTIHVRAGMSLADVVKAIETQIRSAVASVLDR